MLYIFAGLPGTGKTTLAKHLANQLRAVYLRIDTIEQAIRNKGFSDLFDEGYQVGFDIALENLQLGNIVIADSTNPVLESREAWHQVAREANANFFNIEVICSDSHEHRARVETRATDIASLKLPDWDSVSNREYHPWSCDRIILDTAGKTPEQSGQDLMALLALN